jgi:hypothetical protein
MLGFYPKGKGFPQAAAGFESPDASPARKQTFAHSARYACHTFSPAATYFVKIGARQLRIRLQWVKNFHRGETQ